ncbi:LOB domain-containing protein 37 [Apostasia shenzhenica]|uniref:LOB domain-containing protein 37 n=1 Tax=Apostasia shenzhenica TaxID=1088818 RepID=A0A2I0A2M6_9ASPA|nr:LOB domain-containing protein 37 [Apostasia shenzhenica]
MSASTMSCNGCRVLRKGCSESCVLRPCLQWIESPEAQGHATVFVAKFFGRAGLMSFISAVPDLHRPALFHSLLFEACGRTINPVNGAVGLLWTGNWHLCHAAVEIVLRGGTLRPLPELSGSIADSFSAEEDGDGDLYAHHQIRWYSHPNRQNDTPSGDRPLRVADLELCLNPPSAVASAKEQRWPGTPSIVSEDSFTTSAGCRTGERSGLLNLFV